MILWLSLQLVYLFLKGEINFSAIQYAYAYRMRKICVALKFNHFSRDYNIIADILHDRYFYEIIVFIKFQKLISKKTLIDQLNSQIFSQQP